MIDEPSLSYLAKNPGPPAPDHGQQAPHAHSYSLPPPILPSHQNPLFPPYPINFDREPKSQAFNHPVALDTYSSSIKSKPNPVNNNDYSKALSNSLTNVLSDIEAPVANIVLPTLITHVPDQTYNNQNASFTPNLPPVTNVSPLDYQGPRLSSAVSYKTPLPSTFLSDVQIPSTADTLYYESPVPNTFSVDNLAPSITPSISYETPDSFPNRFPIPAPGGPVPHPEGAAPIPVPAPHPAVPKVIPEYTPGKPAPVPTKEKPLAILLFILINDTIYNDQYCMSRTGTTYDNLNGINSIMNSYKSCTKVQSNNDGDGNGLVSSLIKYSTPCVAADFQLCSNDAAFLERSYGASSVSIIPTWTSVSSAHQTWITKLKYVIGGGFLLASFIMFTGILFTNRRRRRAMMMSDCRARGRWCHRPRRLVVWRRSNSNEQ